LFVVQFIPRKGTAELLEAFASIPPEKATLALAGSGELKPLVETYATKHPHIQLLGFMEPAALVAAFAQYDLFILPSRHDGWAVVVAEAMAAGLPVIGTRHTGAFVDLVAPNRCGVACEVNAASMTAALATYIEEPERITVDGAKARETLLHSRAEARVAANALRHWLQGGDAATR
jgi:glycosyltransferase involved in cell wall biosynthesis